MVFRNPSDCVWTFRPIYEHQKVIFLRSVFWYTYQLDLVFNVVYRSKFEKLYRVRFNFTQKALPVFSKILFFKVFSINHIPTLHNNSNHVSNTESYSIDHNLFFWNSSIGLRGTIESFLVLFLPYGFFWPHLYILNI